MVRHSKLFHCLAKSIGAILVAIYGLSASWAWSADFFVQANGNDSAMGTSRRAAWRTVERVNNARLKPGDRILFRGGETFTGNLQLTADDAGTSGNPVTIGSFGKEPAILSAGVNTGLAIENAGWISIENLILIGNGITNNSGYGIFCENTLTNGMMLEHLSIKNVEVRGFGKQGILIVGQSKGFRHVRVSHCVIRDNLFGGIEIAGRLSWNTPGCSHADVIVSDCLTYDNPGDPRWHTRHSGSGIVLLQVDGGMIERSAAWNNGHANGSHTGGPVGIWTCASKRVIIQHCESFGNGTSGADGGGFDIDGGCEECVLQYNYSHDNDGPGLMVYTYPYECRPHRANVVRFNISENDSRKNRNYAGLWVRNDNDGIIGLEIYNNTIVVGSWTDQTASINGEGLDARLRNNLFLAEGGAVPLRVEKAHSKLRFENNLYWQEDSPVLIFWDRKAYRNLSDWRRATGMESLNGQTLGVVVNPKLTRIQLTASDHHTDIAELRAFRPLPKSPVRYGGLNLRESFGTTWVAEDFAGKRLPVTGPWPLGAFAE